MEHKNIPSEKSFTLSPDLITVSNDLELLEKYIKNDFPNVDVRKYQTYKSDLNSNLDENLPSFKQVFRTNILKCEFYLKLLQVQKNNPWLFHDINIGDFIEVGLRLILNTLSSNNSTQISFKKFEKGFIIFTTLQSPLLIDHRFELNEVIKEYRNFKNTPSNNQTLPLQKPSFEELVTKGVEKYRYHYSNQKKGLYKGHCYPSITSIDPDTYQVTLTINSAYPNQAAYITIVTLEELAEIGAKFLKGVDLNFNDSDYQKQKVSLAEKLIAQSQASSTTSNSSAMSLPPSNVYITSLSYEQIGRTIFSSGEDPQVIAKRVAMSKQKSYENPNYKDCGKDLSKLIDLEVFNQRMDKEHEFFTSQFSQDNKLWCYVPTNNQNTFCAEMKQRFGIDVIDVIDVIDLQAIVLHPADALKIYQDVMIKARIEELKKQQGKIFSIFHLSNPIAKEIQWLTTAQEHLIMGVATVTKMVKDFGQPSTYTAETQKLIAHLLACELHAFSDLNQRTQSQNNNNI